MCPLRVMTNVNVDVDLPLPKLKAPLCDTAGIIFPKVNCELSYFTNLGVYGFKYGYIQRQSLLPSDGDGTPLPCLQRGAHPPTQQSRVLRMRIGLRSDRGAVGDVGLPDFRDPEIGTAR